MEKEYKFKERNSFKILVYVGLVYLPLLFAINIFVDKNFRLIDSSIGFLFNPYNMLWVGFYSSYYMLKDLKKNILNFLLLLINIAIILLYVAISLIGGLGGLLVILFLTITPILPIKLIVYLLERSKNKALEKEKPDGI